MNIKNALVLSSVSILSLASRAEIYLDQEHDPLPMVELSVVFPVGFEARKIEESGVANLLPDIVESGTQKLGRQEFLEKLAEYGATTDFSISNQYSQYSLSFPIVEGKNYDPLIQLLRENWQTPRFDEQNFEISKTKFKSALQAALDNDFALISSTARRWHNFFSFDGFPIFLDRIDTITLAQTAQIFERDFARAPKIWAGVVAPNSSIDLIKKLLSQVFAKQGKVKVGSFLNELPSLSEKKARFSPKREVLIIDKDQRTQLVTTVVAISKDKLRAKNELEFRFANHILFDSGLASVFSDEIRTRRGLAYSVGSGLKQLYGRPVLSVSMNPVREKSAEAMDVLSSLLKGSFESGSIINDLPQDVFDRQLRSFKNANILAAATPAGRLSERSAVVSGEMSREYFNSDPSSWNPGRAEMKEVVSNIWSQSAVVIGFVGDASEIKPLVERFFPNYKIKVIPYKDSVLSKTFVKE